jgi:hypothetical protein
MRPFVACFARPQIHGLIWMTASQRVPALLTALRRAVRSAARGLRQVHEEQLLIWELWWQAGRAIPPGSGPLAWILTLDGYRLAGSHLSSQTTPPLSGAGEDHP